MTGSQGRGRLCTWLRLHAVSVHLLLLLLLVLMLQQLLLLHGLLVCQVLHLLLQLLLLLGRHLGCRLAKMHLPRPHAIGEGGALRHALHVAGISWHRHSWRMLLKRLLIRHLGRLLHLAREPALHGP